MERSDILTAMGSLKLYGMKAAYDAERYGSTAFSLATAVKRQHEPERIVGDLLTAEISEKQARSIKYQMTIAKMPLAKDIDDFVFEGSPINETLIRDLSTGNFLEHQRNCVLVGGTGTGKTHLAIAIARACIRDRARGRFFNVIDLVKKLEAEARADRHGKMADRLARMDFVILDELGYLPFAQTGGQLLFHLISHLYEQTSVIVTTNLDFGDDRCISPPAHGQAAPDLGGRDRSAATASVVGCPASSPTPAIKALSPQAMPLAPGSGSRSSNGRRTLTASRSSQAAG